MMKCKFCGLPMEKVGDFSGGDINNKYCKYCVPDVNLISLEKIKGSWIIYDIKSVDISQEEVENKADD